MRPFALLILLLMLSRVALSVQCSDLAIDGTIRYYDLTAKTYSDQTFKMDADKDSPVRKNQDFFLSHLEPGDLILDAGAGSGRDTLRFLNEGFNVKAIDASPMQVAQAQRNTGHPVRLLAFENMIYANRFEGIWAMASLIHVRQENFVDVMARMSRALKLGGYFFLTLRYGEGETVLDDGRYFNSFTEKSFNLMLKNFPEFEVIRMTAPEIIWRDNYKLKSLEVLLHKITLNND